MGTDYYTPLSTALWDFLEEHLPDDDIEELHADAMSDLVYLTMREGE